MSRLILDIETVGADFDSLDPALRAHAIKRAGSEEEARETLGLSPLTGEIVGIGLLNADTGRGAMYYQNPGDLPLSFEEGGIRFESGDEAHILRKFWKDALSCRSIVTFNGRGFDCPFILVRSAVRRVRPTKDLMPNRYGDGHIDLFDRLSFYGASRLRYGLDLWCRALGITSPKEEVAGHQVGELFAAGRYLEIARYCVRDLYATRELFELWDTYMRGET